MSKTKKTSIKHSTSKKTTPQKSTTLTLAKTKPSLPWLWVAILAAVGTLLLIPSFAAENTSFPTERDPKKWPFSRYSIWNMPIGDGAEYVDANLLPATNYFPEQNIIIMKPDAPLRTVYLANGDGWSGGRASRCVSSGKDGYSGLKFPIPTGFDTNSTHGGTPNHSASILMPDGVTVRQTQPLSVCNDNLVTTFYFCDICDAADPEPELLIDNIIDGDGTLGAQGGSRMSGLGGAIRLGELTKDAGPIRHALKIVLDIRNFYFDRTSDHVQTGNTVKGKGFRWPAVRHDGYAPDKYYGTNPEVQMGSLLALHKDLDINSLGLETEPARRIAQALQDYGAYPVDESGPGANDNYISFEYSPDGDAKKEVEAEWGISLVTSSKANPWHRDLDRIFAALSVVTNNTETSIGGGGNPRVCYAPKIEGETKPNPNGNVTEPAGCPVYDDSSSGGGSGDGGSNGGSGTDGNGSGDGSTGGNGGSGDGGSGTDGGSGSDGGTDGGAGSTAPLTPSTTTPAASLTYTLTYTPSDTTTPISSVALRRVGETDLITELTTPPYVFSPLTTATTAAGALFGTNGTYQLEAVIVDTNNEETITQPFTLNVRLPDINRDTVTDLRDILEIITTWGQLNKTETDLNDDQVIDLRDILVVITNWTR